MKRPRSTIWPSLPYGIAEIKYGTIKLHKPVYKNMKRTSVSLCISVEKETNFAFAYIQNLTLKL